MKNPALRIAAALLLAAAPTTLVSLAACAQVRVSQIYGGGGNSGAVYRYDFIELFNAGPRPVDLTGWSVQYSSSSGVNWQKTRLGGTILPWSWFLIQEAMGSGGTAELPVPEVRGTIAISSTAGKVALVSDTVALEGSCPGAASVTDLVGFGPATRCFEGSGPAPAPGNTTAIFRKGRGVVETNDNARDFETGPPAPRNSAAPPLAARPEEGGREPADGRSTAPVLLNYPNPFNPSTQFEFEVGRSAQTTLVLYNLLGEAVACLFDGTARSGRRYVVPFHAGALPAGIYLARLRSSSGSAAIAVALLK